jgi:hypothetical protein
MVGLRDLDRHGAVMLLVAIMLGCTVASRESDAPDTSVAPSTRTWARVTNYPCGIDTEGFVECWRSVRWDEFTGTTGTLNPRVWPLDVSFPVEHLNAPTGGLVWAVRADTGVASIIQCHGSCGHPEQHVYTDIGHRCGLYGASIGCFGVDEVSFGDSKQYTHLAYEYGGSGSAVPVALTVENALVFPAHPQAAYNLPSEVDVEALVGFDSLNACALTRTGDILCEGANPPSFDNPPYVMLSGGGQAACAVREDWLIECTDGSTFDFGPLRHLEVTSLAHWEPWVDTGLVTPLDGTVPDFQITYPTAQDPPHVCVVTQDNAIRCVGPHYDYPDLQQALPAGD